MSVDLIPLLENAGVLVRWQAGDEIWAPCPNPAHDDNNPSWSISTHAPHPHSCFSCGYKGSLRSLLKELTGEVPVDLTIELQTQSFLRNITEYREREEVPEIPILTEWALGNILASVPQRLRDLRGLCPDALEAYEVKWDKEFKQWVLPLRNQQGTLLGAQYRQKGDVFTLPMGLRKRDLIFGLHQATQHHVAAVTESPLDAVRLYQTGIPAFSTLGAYVSKEQLAIMSRNFSMVVIAMDNDDAGTTSTEMIRRGLKKRGCIGTPLDYNGLVDEDGRPAKDPGDVAEDDALRRAWQRAVRLRL